MTKEDQEIEATRIAIDRYYKASLMSCLSGQDLFDEEYERALKEIQSQP